MSKMEEIMKKNQLLLVLFIAINFIFSQDVTVSMGSGSVNAGESVTIEVDLANPVDAISGFQFQIIK